ncbi:ABC transporter ATP-binding protein [Desulfosediminicola ganghwensis]|uniref:ABC transporter ATP-binding protein n=1 Tax=Desulfosediminicola ganghwensis TaxID=2569540 RepID=UPI0010AC4B0E|nr:ABC transporter ATP-binding protein [Desulfosediminicola ganghwensis]
MRIELEGVTKIYNRGESNEVIALQRVDLAIASGEMVCLRGASGSGKTTLLSIIGCIFPPSSGRAELGGKKVSRLPDHFLCRFRREKIGFIFQDFNIIGDLSVIENVSLPLFPAGVSGKDRTERAAALLSSYHLMERAYFKADSISGGELQRVAICRALINNPPVIIADEPTAHLDSGLATSFMDSIAQLKKQGKTIVIASHDPRVFERVEIDRVMDVVDGRVLPEVDQQSGFRDVVNERSVVLGD